MLSSLKGDWRDGSIYIYICAHTHTHTLKNGILIPFFTPLRDGAPKLHDYTHKTHNYTLLEQGAPLFGASVGLGCRLRVWDSECGAGISGSSIGIPA